MKKGFTLIELLLVIAILSITGVSCVIAFDKIYYKSIDKSSVNAYKLAQNAAIIYMELDDRVIKDFAKNKVTYIPYMTLRSEILISDDIDSNIKYEDKGNLYIKIYIAEDSKSKEYVTSEIVTKEEEESGFKCYKDINGKDCEI